MSAIDKLQLVIGEQRKQFIEVTTDPTIQFEREAQFAMQVLEQNTYLASTALANEASLRNAINNVAAIGITLNPASKLAYLVPRDRKVCLDISYMGLMHIAQQSGAIKWGQARVVREKDNFVLRGIDQPPVHEYNPFGTDRGEIVGGYVVVKTDDNDYLTHCMTIDAVNKIRDRSSAWKAWVKDKKSCPWVTDYDQMLLKSIVKQAAKYWPRRDRLDTAVHHLNTDSDEGIYFQAEEKDITPCSEEQARAITAKTKELGRDKAALMSVCKHLFKRDIEQLADLTADEADRVMAFLSSKRPEAATKEPSNAEA